ncbi:wound-induced protein 1-like [Rutidosis leptorrhynchoides]|uniref:wound-induced protein 1-like n=1 Tax=Rutidosis leptorrhynchoides TaxID=125765 RepID=UPI003A99D13B
MILKNNNHVQDEEERNEKVVRDLYEALISKDVEMAQRLLARDLEWWFHGPPMHQRYLMALLTSGNDDDCFVFVPEIQSIASFGSLVIVEGFEKQHSVWWVHAWTVDENGIITGIKEYLNTSVTVTQLMTNKYCHSVWQSMLSDNNSVPGLVLAL